MKTKLNLTKQDAKTVHDEFYEPARLLAEQGEIPKQKAPNRPMKDVKGKSSNPYLSTGRTVRQ